MVEYKDRLNAAMKDAGYTTATLAADLHVTYQAVKKAQSGNSNGLSAANNSKAAKLLNVSTDWLALGEGAKARFSNEFPWPFSTPYSIYESLDDEKRRRLDERMADFLAGAALSADTDRPDDSQKKIATFEGKGEDIFQELRKKAVKLRSGDTDERSKNIRTTVARKTGRRS